MIFDIENWLWKSEFRDLHGQISNLLQRESAIYHSIKLGFEGQVAKKFLNGIYCLVLSTLFDIEYVLTFYKVICLFISYFDKIKP